MVGVEGWAGESATLPKSGGTVHSELSPQAELRRAAAPAASKTRSRGRRRRSRRRPRGNGGTCAWTPPPSQRPGWPQSCRRSVADDGKVPLRALHPQLVAAAGLRLEPDEGDAAGARPPSARGSSGSRPAACRRPRSCGSCRPCFFTTRTSFHVLGRQSWFSEYEGLVGLAHLPALELGTNLARELPVVAEARMRPEVAESSRLMSQSLRAWPPAPGPLEALLGLVVGRAHQRARLVPRGVRVRKDALRLVEGRQAVRVHGHPPDPGAKWDVRPRRPRGANSLGSRTGR
jgi:hypothetical protein